MNDLENRFSYHAPDEAARDKHQALRNEMMSLARWATDQLPEGREKALFMTNLEQAMFWGNAAIARIDAQGDRR